MDIDITAGERKTVLSLLHTYLPGVTVWAFGSRVKFTSKPESDLDLTALIQPEQESRLTDLKEAFADSILPFKVDILEWSTLPDNFKTNIQKEYVVLQDENAGKVLIPENWKPYKLGDFAEINPKIQLKQGNEYSFVEMKDLDPNFKYVSPNAKRVFKGGSKFEDGDTLFARITPCLENGKISQVKNLENKIGFGSTEFIIFRGKGNLSDTDFTYYLTRSDDVRNKAIQAMTGTSGRQRVEKSSLEKIKIIAPNLSFQKSIAAVFKSLDDKIELNLQMNQTLENIAQLTFKEWFVYFNFPGFNGELVDGLPKGWKTEPIDKEVDFLNGLALQKFPASGQNYLPVIKIRELKQGITDSTDKASVSIPNQYIIKDGDILFSWSGSLEVVIWTGGDGALNQHLFKVASRKFPEWFYYYWTKHFLPNYQSIAEGKVTTMGHIQRKHLTESLINVPNNDILQQADQLISPILERIIQNGIQVRTLTKIRDNLLPKLMTGKIRVN